MLLTLWEERQLLTLTQSEGQYFNKVISPSVSRNHWFKMKTWLHISVLWLMFIGGEHEFLRSYIHFFQHNFSLWPQKGQCCFRDYCNASPTYTYSSSSQKGSLKNLLKFYLLLWFRLHLTIMHECMVYFYLSIYLPR